MIIFICTSKTKHYFFFFLPSSKYPTFIVLLYIFIPHGITSRIFDIHNCCLSVPYLFQSTGTYFENTPKRADIFFGLRILISLIVHRLTWTFITLLPLTFNGNKNQVEKQTFYFRGC